MQEPTGPRLRFSDAMSPAFKTAWTKLPAVATTIWPWLVIGAVISGLSLPGSLQFMLDFQTAMANGAQQSAMAALDFGWVGYLPLSLLAALPVYVGAMQAVHAGGAAQARFVPGNEEVSLGLVWLILFAVIFGGMMVVGFIGGVLAGVSGSYLFVVLGYLAFGVVAAIALARAAPVMADAALNGAASMEGYRRSHGNLLAIILLLLVAFVVGAIWNSIIGTLVQVLAPDSIYGRLPEITRQALESGQAPTLEIGFVEAFTYSLLFTVWSIPAYALYASTLVTIFGHLGGEGPEGPAVADGAGDRDLP